MNKRRIIFTALVGTIALAALSVSISLAWYGASDRLGVSNLDVHIYSGANLKVSTSDDLNSFKESVDMDDFPSEYQSMLFSPTSSMYQKEWFDETGAQRVNKPSFYDIYTDNLRLSPDGEPTINKSTTGFFSEDLYFITNFDYYISLEVDVTKDNHSTFENNKIANEIRANDLYRKYGARWGLSEEEILAKLNGLLDCLRVSILVLDENQYSYYIIDPTKQNNDVTLYGGVLDTNGDGYNETYRPAGEVATEIMYGDVNDRSLIRYDDYHDDSSSSSSSESDTEYDERPNTFFGNCFAGKTIDGARKYNAEASKENGFKITEESSLSLADIEESNARTTEPEEGEKSLLIPCHSNVPSHVVLSIYLEGWDLDCINATMGASFDIKLNFKLIRGIQIDG